MSVAQEKWMSEPEVVNVPDVLWIDLGGIIRWAGETHGALVGTALADLPFLGPEGRATLSALAAEATCARPVDATVRVELPYAAAQTLTAYALRLPGDASAARVLVGFSRPRGVPDLRRLRELDHLAGAGRIALGAAHDLNNVLVVLGLGLRELVEDGAAGGTLERLRELEQMVQRASHVVRRFRTAGPVVPMHVDVVELGDLLRETHRALAMLAGGRMRLAVHSTSWPIRVRGGRAALEQVLMNLVSNASDAARGEGHIVVTATQLRWPGGRVHSGGRLRPGVYGVLEVSDDGPGLAPEQIERLFEPFYTTKPVGVGTGLGLTLVAETAIEAGGGVLVDSPPGAGATFRVLLPMAA
jgi:two-component system cell cycle sensor histidine kinase/response regulator CckA